MFRHGDRVKIKKLKREGIVVDGPTKARKYLIAVNAMQYWINSDDIEPCLGKPKSSKKAAVSVTAQSGKPRKSIDLHGLTASIAEERVMEFLSQAILSGQNEIHIIHGIGTGKLKTTVHKALDKTKAVSHYLIAPGNPGTTIVYL